MSPSSPPLRQLLLDELAEGVGVLVDLPLVGAFDHHADAGLGAAGADDQTADILVLLLHSLDGSHDGLVLVVVVLFAVGYVGGVEDLGHGLHDGGQLAQGLAGLDHGGDHLHGGNDAIAGGYVKLKSEIDQMFEEAFAGDEE